MGSDLSTLVSSKIRSCKATSSKSRKKFCLMQRQKCFRRMVICLPTIGEKIQMGKITLDGFVPKDDPMFWTGPQMFSRPEYSRSSRTSVSGTDGRPRLNRHCSKSKA
jgi:hypothetical protein